LACGSGHELLVRRRGSWQIGSILLRASRDGDPPRAPVALTSEFGGDRQKQIQWTAFVAKSRLADPSPDLATVVALLRRFLWPVLVGLSKTGTAGTIETMWTIAAGWG
jgi:hypothetical protein